ncbi:ABC transporter ATP-binding protein [Mucisphaera calidilacus]|uniref:Putative ABC transporter ATP-binding protein YbhF n=1 Tax=Mucisphaera calidilacus TaxID=2527982 RepID=A0A518BWN3_9BACT|nr:ABC transporter ATP-binding protein [Mucisphaera calidilacus]QDU71387.1 putative ABC transporter ATP-binding protein YbhF [Mucisphaera calidilacus]
MGMIQTQNLTKKYGELVALDHLTLTVEEGDAFGFLGPNGAGKTTTMKILSTLLKPTWGEARIDGLSVGPVNAQEVRRIIAYVPDFFGSYADLTVTEYLEFFAASYGIMGQDRRRVIGDVLELTDLTGKSLSEVNGLSRGMQQRLSVARALLHDPKLLLLDEPASGLDPRARVEMRELLKELHRMGKTILISSHILPELSELCNKFGIIERGKLKFVGGKDELLARTETGGRLHVRVAERADDARRALAGLSGVTGVRVEAEGLLVELEAHHPETVGQIARCLVEAGLKLVELRREEASLETAFMRMTEGAVQ